RVVGGGADQQAADSADRQAHRAAEETEQTPDCRRAHGALWQGVRDVLRRDRAVLVASEDSYGVHRNLAIVAQALKSGGSFVCFRLVVENRDQHSVHGLAPVRVDDAYVDGGTVPLMLEQSVCSHETAIALADTCSLFRLQQQRASPSACYAVVVVPLQV